MLAPVMWVSRSLDTRNAEVVVEGRMYMDNVLTAKTGLLTDICDYEGNVRAYAEEDVEEDSHLC